MFGQYLAIIGGIIVIGLAATQKIADYPYAGDNPFLASVITLAQRVEGAIMPQSATDEGSGNFEGFSPDFVNPQEVKQVLREIQDMKRDLKRFAARARNLTNGEAVRNEINVLLAKTQDYEARMKSTAQDELRPVVEEFRNEELWESINKLRARIELPQQLKSAERELVRLQKMLKQKWVTRLGLNLAGVESWLAESNQILIKLRALYSAGDWDALNEEMQDLHERAHPGEIVGTLHRMREITDRLRKIRDQQTRAVIEEALREVTVAFNEGDYRAAREILDEYHDDLMWLIAQVISKRRDFSAERFFQQSEQLEGLIREKRIGIEERERLEDEQKKPAPPEPPRPTENIMPIPAPITSPTPTKVPPTPTPFATSTPATSPAATAVPFP